MLRALFIVLALLAAPLLAQTAPAVAEHDAITTNFRFNDGKALPRLVQHYRTIGQPDRNANGEITNAVMVLHGTGGTGAQFLQPQFARLFAPGAPLDAGKFFIILPDAIGHGGSSKPSDGLKQAFPAYDYADMVRAQKALLDQLGVAKLRLLMGTSMGCMMGFQFGTDYPQIARAMMPLACNTVPLAGRNRLWRALVMQAIRTDPAFKGGDYTAQPPVGAAVNAVLGAMASSMPVRMQQDLPDRDAADAAATKVIANAMAGFDANDRLYQLDASRNYNPSPNLARITMPVTWVNSADDFINPPGLGIAEREALKLPNARFVMVPESADTRGHSTHTWSKFWEAELVALLARSE